MSVDDAVEEKSKRRRKRRNKNADEEILEAEAEERGLTERKGRATPGKRSRSTSTQQSSGGFLSRLFGGIRGYFGGVKDELDKVVWPTREELFRLSRIVFTVTVISAMALGAISFVYSEIFYLGLNKDQPIIFVLLFGGVGFAYWYISRRSRTNITP